MKNKSVAIGLALILGGIGAHHFYLGNKGRGVVYFLLSWTLMPVIAAVVDALILMTFTTEQFHEFYNLATLPVELSDSQACDIGKYRESKNQEEVEISYDINKAA